jgi:arsenical pump membrane protein
VTGAPAEALALVLLAAVLVTAAVAPRWQTWVAVPAAALLAGVGAVSVGGVESELRQLAPVVGFLVAVLVLAAMCDREGLFTVAGGLVGRLSRGSGVRLLAGSVALAAAATVVLSLDTTVVLVTPVVVAAARSRRLDPAPAAYASAHLANSGSLLLPVSNLTNLLALAVVPIGFGRFAALMLLPWLVMVAVEWIGVRLVFRPRLAGASAPGPEPARLPVPVVAALVVALTLAGFVVASAVDVPVAWPAGAGALALAVWVLVRRRTSLAGVVVAGQIPFAVFVLALGIVVRSASVHGLASVLRDMLPVGSSLPALLGVAAVSAIAANVLNNLPATLALLPLVAGRGVGPVLAVLIGVDVGPNLTYPGSLATLLWRRQVGELASLRRWTVLGLATVPIGITLAVVGLWLALCI